MTTAPTGARGNRTQSDLVARAAVLVTFDLASFASGEDVDELLVFLGRSCERVRIPSGETVWSLTDSERRRCFADQPLEKLRTARTDVHVDGGPLQEALDRSLGSGWERSQLDLLTPEEARALSVVAGWWDGHRPEVPSVQAATMLVNRLNLFADLRAMAEDHFVDRASILAELRRHFADRSAVPFALHGLGGVGKSALIARHVAWVLDGESGTDPDRGEHGAYAAVLDFDNPNLNPRYLLDIVSHIIDVVARQEDGPVRERLNRLTKVALDAAQTVRFREESSSRAVGRGPVKEIEELLSDLVAFAGHPILVVFDTVEQVQRRGPFAVSSLATLVHALVGLGPRLRVLVSGRAEVPELRVSSHELAGLDRPEAVTLLHDLCSRPVESRTAEAVVDALGTSPLSIRLAARLLSDEDEDAGDLVTLDLHAERIHAELYRRVLDHIRDEDVRRLAHPGLVLRRITPELIEQVLARTCKVRVPDRWTAESLFERLAQEAMLVDRSRDDEALIHRSDVRRVMLPQLRADCRRVADRIQRSAIRYYAARGDQASKSEELYHRLMLSQKPATLDKHWDPRVAEALVGALDELPTPSRIYLTRRLPEIYLNDEDRRLIGDAQWLEEVEPQVARLLAAGDAEKAIQLLSERRGPDGGSLLPSLEIETMEALGNFGRAIALARDNRRAAAIRNEPADVARYTLHLARLLERSGATGDAVTALRKALRSVRAPTVGRLRLLVALLALHRRRGDPPDQESEALRAEASRLHRALGDRQIRRVPGLLRDLAAEVSEVHPAILDEALGIIGVDASAYGLVPGALRDLDESMASERGAPGLVADLAQLGRADDDETSWEAIATKPRGETGRALLEVLRTFGPSADLLRSAVATDYQQEADAALLGYQADVAHKA